MYHISLEKLNENELLFTPRIPKTASLWENKKIPRICLSETIEGCIKAIIHCHIQPELLRCQNQDKDKLLLYVYEPETSPSNEYLLTSKTIKEKKYVNDADHTHEVWILKPTKMKLHTILEVTNVKESFDWLHYADFYGEDDFPYQLQYQTLTKENQV